MKHTPTLDRCGITFKDDLSDGVLNIIDACLSAIESRVVWGGDKGRRRKPCSGQPILLAGAPLGQFHCESCGEMQMAGWPHLDVDPDYEDVYGQEWPAGYEDADG